MDDHRRQALLAEYSEVCDNFRLLTDIRFKLLAFLPIAAAAAASLKGYGVGIDGFALSLFGLAATIGLVTYNTRNDQLYNELVGRAASIERSLGLRDGAFANRPRAWLTIRLPGVKWTIEHGTGVGIIYTASIALWLVGVLAPLLELTRHTYLRLGCKPFVVSDPSAWVQMSALALAVLVTLLMARWIKVQRARRTEEMRFLAGLAVARAEQLQLADTAKDESLINLCAKLSSEKADTIRAREILCVDRS